MDRFLSIDNEGIDNRAMDISRYDLKAVMNLSNRECNVLGCTLNFVLITSKYRRKENLV